MLAASICLVVGEEGHKFSRAFDQLIGSAVENKRERPSMEDS